MLRIIQLWVHVRIIQLWVHVSNSEMPLTIRHSRKRLRNNELHNSSIAKDKITHSADSQFKVARMRICNVNLAIKAEGRGKALVSNVIRSYAK